MQVTTSLKDLQIMIMEYCGLEVVIVDNLKVAKEIVRTQNSQK